jgi:VWFA-related protein
MTRSVLLVVITALTLQAAQVPTLRVDVPLAQIIVTVTDSKGRLVTDLRRGDFTVEVDGAPHDIAVFTQDADTPIALGLLLDMSGSMVSRLREVKQAGSAFIRGMRPTDEYFLMTFADSSKIVQGLTNNREQLIASLNSVNGGAGGTELLSSIIKASETLQKSKNSKRALVVITDGVDTGCRMSETEFQEKLVETETIAYGVRLITESGAAPLRGIPPILGRQTRRCPTPPGANRFFELLESETGGRAFVVRPATRTLELDLDLIFDEISAELRGQYTIGVYLTASNPKAPGVIRVRAKSPDYKIRARREVAHTR